MKYDVSFSQGSVSTLFTVRKVNMLYVYV